MDFRLKVFVTVAHTQNFTKAAKELYLSQPAVSKHIRELEERYKTPLFDRRGARMCLTSAGELLLKHAEAILARYREMDIDMSMLSENLNGEFRIAASTTISQYLLPEVLAGFMKRFPDININLTTANTDQVENLVENGNADLGIVEGNSHRQGLRYSQFARDELVIVTNTKTRCGDEITAKELKTLPLVMRESGSGTLDVIETEFNRNGIKLSDLHTILHLDNTESIKRFLENSTSTFAIIPIISAVGEIRDGKLKVIDCEIEFSRYFSLVTSIGYKNPITDKFTGYISLHHNQKL